MKNERYCITSDELNWRIEKVRSYKGKPRWAPIEYFHSLGQAMRQLGERMLREANCSSIRELVQENERIAKMLQDKLMEVETAAKQMTAIEIPQ